MFTGIIEELGVVKSLTSKGAISTLQISAPGIARDTHPAQSVCLNGVCLTVVKVEKDTLSFEIMQQTLKDTSLGLLKFADKVNLERALRVNGRLDGHFVSGHIDGTGNIRKSQKEGGDLVLEITTASEQILPYVTLKGSVALDGVSLTVSAQAAGSFCVHLIPYTVSNTTLGRKKERDLVNIECDILAKYMHRFTSQDQGSRSSITPSFLKEQGFI